MTIMQRIHENGLWIPGIKMSRAQCQDFWKSKTNASRNNSPLEYATKDLSMIEAMTRLIEPYISIHQSILELGSNCGVNLNSLQNNEFKNLNGIEINHYAIEEMYNAFPYINAHIHPGNIETVIKQFKTNRFDLVFSMAVLEHVHPASNFVFDEIARISKNCICTCEIESSTGCSYIFERDYKRVFEKRGFKQIRAFNMRYGGSTYTMRLLRKYKQEDYSLVMSIF